MMQIGGVIQHGASYVILDPLQKWSASLNLSVPAFVELSSRLGALPTVDSACSKVVQAAWRNFRSRYIPQSYTLKVSYSNPATYTPVSLR